MGPNALKYTQLVPHHTTRWYSLVKKILPLEVILSFHPPHLPRNEMAGFSDLCKELVLEILRHVAPRDLGSACAVTKSISYLAAPILAEHRRLKQWFSSIDNFGDRDPSLARFLIKILAKPRIAHYVRSLTVDSWGPVWEAMTDNARSPASTKSRCRSNNLQLVRTALQKTQIIRADEVDEWLQAIQHSTEDHPILALLLLQLPNLEDLEISSIGMPIEYLSRTTQRIKNAPAGTYLSHLKHVSINIDTDWEDPDLMKIFDSFISLPSLASCCIEGLTIGNEERDFEWHLRPHELNIVDLAFIHCNIGEKALFEVLGCTKNLKSFTLTSLRSDSHSTRQLPDWYWLGVGLLHHAKQSLEKLILLPQGTAYTESCSLREFKVLREIDTKLALFFNDPDSSVRGFPEMLPPSIRIIRLRPLTWPFRPSMRGVNVSRTLEQIREAILSTLEVKDVLLPQLSEIHVFTGDDAPNNVFWDIPKACDAQGVLFSFSVR